MTRDKILETFEDIEHLMYKHIRNVLTGIKNVIIWFPVIWKDRQWDFIYFLEIIKFKLEQMVRFYETEAHQIKAEKHVDKMKLCITIINRIIDDNYHDIAFKSYYDKWGETQIKFIKNEENSCETMEITHSKVITPADKIKSLAEYSLLCGREEYLVKQDIKLLFNIFTKHLRSWWD